MMVEAAPHGSSWCLDSEWLRDAGLLLSARNRPTPRKRLSLTSSTGPARGVHSRLDAILWRSGSVRMGICVSNAAADSFRARRLSVPSTNRLPPSVA